MRHSVCQTEFRLRGGSLSLNMNSVPFRKKSWSHLYKSPLGEFSSALNSNIIGEASSRGRYSSRRYNVIFELCKEFIIKELAVVS